MPKGTFAVSAVTTVANIAPSEMKAPARTASTKVRVTSSSAFATPRSDALAAMAGGNGASAAPGGGAATTGPPSRSALAVGVAIGRP